MDDTDKFEDFSEDEKALQNGDSAADAAETEPTADKAEREPVPETPEKQPDKRVVPLAALHEERERRKELAAQVASEAEKRAKMEARFEAMVHAMEQQKQSESKPAAPNPDEDPLAYIKAQGEAIDRLSRRQEDFTSAQQQSAQVNRMIETYRHSASEFAQKSPDFMAAYNHLLKERREELRDLGYTDPVTLDTMLQNDEFALVAQSLQAGQNPAEKIYALAKRRGYKPADTKMATADVLDRIEKGQQAAKSVGAASGGPAPKISLEALANMDDEEFASAIEGKNWKRLISSLQ